MARDTPAQYEKKFADFIRMCVDAQASGIKQIVVPTPATIGDNYPEIIESLSRLAEAGLTLAIASPEPRRNDVSRN